jgi:hypothetical protein
VVGDFALVEVGDVAEDCVYPRGHHCRNQRLDPPGRGPSLGSRQRVRREEFQRDVVRIPEGQSRTVGSMDDTAVDDTEFV